MIAMYYAPPELQTRLTQVNGERELLKLVTKEIALYDFATKIDSFELDLAFAAAGGISPWVMADNLPEVLNQPLLRTATFGDLLVETVQGYVNLATPAGFIPVIDVEYNLGLLRQKQFN
ncbi:MAG: hypothetical protein NWQ54_22580 [Paraglaciecola sp.]|uniref:hypothetical protein n=1 Tax=Pseudomonadati TaxID=3379134 RepID=UPI00273D09AC|nr:hypothetical protein [Paraglaciecola sp.]MDP5032951.1 hypothetical protein [Paraglaciecola sp.]MDP5133680.1 hypothetical protein [Paraglaciecola sp.]